MPTVVLIAEDNLTLRWLLVKQLEHLGLQVDCAGDGEEAFERFRKHPGYELVLMEVLMPRINGYSAAHLIREFERSENVHRRTPIIGLTCDSTNEACIAAGMDGSLQKPFSPEQLEDILKSWLPEKRLSGLRRGGAPSRTHV